MAVRSKATVKNPYGDDKGFGAPSSRRRNAPTTDGRIKPRHFVRLFMDDCGNIQIDSSVSMNTYTRQIFSNEIMERFRDACHRSDTGVDPSLPLKGDGQSSPSATKRTSKKRRKSDHETSGSCNDMSHTMSNPMSDEVVRRNGKMMSICVSDRESILRYYATCLRAFQQINCRTICKLWIKLIHPKKQVTNPYNGSIKEEGCRDPERTKPLWWHPTTRHKEPDHLKKEERIALMVHLIDQCVRDDNHFPEKITIEQLYGEVAKKKYELNGGASNDPMGKLALIRDICDLRVMQQRWEESEIDDDAIATVESHEEHAKKEERDEAMREAKLAAQEKTKDAKLPATLQAMEPTEEPLVLTPTSSTTSPNVYGPSYSVVEREPPRHNPNRCQPALGPYSPQSMASYHSVSGSSPFHEMHQMHPQAMMFAQQPGFNTTGLDQAQEHVANLGETFVPITRSDSMTSWPTQVQQTPNSYGTPITSFASESIGAPTIHTIPLDQLAFNSHQFPASQDEVQLTANCFQPINQFDSRQLDPRQLTYETWNKYGRMS